MDLQVIYGFIAVSFALAMTPGADWAYAISAGLGRHRVSSAVAGLCSGYIFHTLLIVGGMAALIAGMPQLLSWLTLIGAAYLLWLGIGTARSWRGAGFSAEEGTEPEPYGSGMDPTEPGTAGGGADTLRRTTTMVATTAEARERFLGPAFFRGLGTSGTNPKALLLYLALIPQFIHADAALPVPVQTAILGTSHMVLSLFIYTGVTLGARALLRQRPTAARFITLASGLIMIALGLLLLIEQAPTLLGSIQMLAAMLGH
ncbi:LysE family translocator [Paeniglutamicibacter sp. ABSL32-1]|uniref:LysE family translocator n=1 Tax=Paeniglutamicibacter quisquiliarum TaxID=2849498 RepID=UPI001C2CF3FE|nr:LysE family translocator [Paeniglutamicibacter quisquiliarum]MBV1778271.1 LysE family translocator [Paeniglutamicibacter quisquiliarum]